jgi:hypothetical protein
MHHNLKILPAFFESVLDGSKRFEIRWDEDRGFQKRDTVCLNEVRERDLMPTGRRFEAIITYVSNYKQQPGYVVFCFQQPNAEADLPPPANSSTINSRSAAVQSSDLLGGSNVEEKS